MSTLDSVAARIIDANLNRAREALRVMEEYARLALQDAGLAAAIKDTRHALATAVVEFENRIPHGTLWKTERAEGQDSGERRGSLLTCRDIEGDVGCRVSAAAEYERFDTLDVATAAGKRLGEALRAVEEYSKTADSAFAAAVEKIRYRGYGLERRLDVTSRAKNRFGRVRLYVIVTESLCGGTWLATAEAALRGGADCVQLREKDLSDGELLDRAGRLADLCHGRDALFIVNDRPDIAVLSGADGVHLGQQDLPVAAARRVVSPSHVIGISTHDMKQVEAAAAAAPDYIAVGPMFATPTKPQTHVAGPGLLASAREHTSLPVVAVGGIDQGNIARVLSVGAVAVCVCRAVVGQADPAAAASRLRALVEDAARKHTARR